MTSRSDGPDGAIIVSINHPLRDSGWLVWLMLIAILRIKRFVQNYEAGKQIGCTRAVFFDIGRPTDKIHLNTTSTHSPILHIVICYQGYCLSYVVESVFCFRSRTRTRKPHFYDVKG